MRCYFHLAGPETELLDEQGVEVGSVEEARAEALKAIAELRREDASLQEDWNGWSLRIVSEGGEVLSTIRLNAISYPVAGRHRQPVRHSSRDNGDTIGTDTE